MASVADRHRWTDPAVGRTDAGASYGARGRGLYLLLSGAAACEGKALKQHSTLFVDYGEHASLRASEDAEFLHYGLPDFSQNAASVSESTDEMKAAE